MGMFDNEIAADNQMRRFDELSKMPGGKLVASAKALAGAVSLVTGSCTVGLIAHTLGVAEKFTPALGVATLDENIDHLGNATEAAIARHEEQLIKQGVSIEEINKRIESPEFAEGISAAVLHSQRTKQKKRLERMAQILANGLAVNDLEPEGLDDMMRAAVDLNEHDLLVLQEIYKIQKDLFSTSQLQFDYSSRISNIRSKWQTWWSNEGMQFRKDGGMAFRSSITRLMSLGFIMSIGPDSFLNGLMINDYELLQEGKRFYERIQETTAD